MSLILEALQRADQERRDSGEVPGIDAEHVIVEPTTHRSDGSVSARIYVPFLLGLVVALALYVLYLQRPIATPATAEPSSTAHANGVESSSADASVSQNRFDNVVSSGVGQQRPDIQTEPKADAPEESATVTTSNSLNNAFSSDRLTPSEIASLYEQAAEQQEPLIDYAEGESSAPIAKQARPAEGQRLEQQQAENSADAVYLGLPFASQLPEYQQRSIPAIRYTTHGYDPKTGVGRVTLNGRSHQRGDSIAGGLLLIDIRADYIVLDMDGTLFRLHAASDWAP